MKIPNLDSAVQERLDNCVKEILVILNKYFPEFRSSYEYDFDERLYLGLYLELIHAGFFKED